jgi:hypothetical protein
MCEGDTTWAQVVNFNSGNIAKKNRIKGNVLHFFTDNVHGAMELSGLSHFGGVVGVLSTRPKGHGFKPG